MRILNLAVALFALIVAFVDEVLLAAIPPTLRAVGAVGDLSEIRLLDNLGYGERALSKGDVYPVGRGKNAIDIETARMWVRAGLAISMNPEDGDPPVPARSHVVVHERGGMELLQAATTVRPGGQVEGPAGENPTDSDPEVDAEAGRARTAAGTVIEENVDPPAVVASESKSGKGGKKK